MPDPAVKPLTREERAAWLKVADALGDHRETMIVSRYEATVRALEAENTRLLKAAADMLELAEEGWVDAGDYFRGKWDVEGRMNRLREALKEGTPDA